MAGEREHDVQRRTIPAAPSAGRSVQPDVRAACTCFSRRSGRYSSSSHGPSGLASVSSAWPRITGRRSSRSSTFQVTTCPRFGGDDDELLLLLADQGQLALDVLGFLPQLQQLARQAVFFGRRKPSRRRRELSSSAR